MKLSLSKFILVSLAFTLLTSTSCPLWAGSEKRAAAPLKDDFEEKGQQKRPSPEKRARVQEESEEREEGISSMAIDEEETEDDSELRSDEKRSQHPDQLTLRYRAQAKRIKNLDGQRPHIAPTMPTVISIPTLARAKAYNVE